MSSLEYVNVNEEGEEYEVHDDLEPALATLTQFPNDSIVIRFTAPEKAEPEHDDDAMDLADDLDNLLDRFDELLTVAESGNYLAVVHKLQEAAGPLSSAKAAAEQYSEGLLKRK